MTKVTDPIDDDDDDDDGFWGSASYPDRFHSDPIDFKCKTLHRLHWIDLYQIWLIVVIAINHCINAIEAVFDSIYKNKTEVTTSRAGAIIHFNVTNLAMFCGTACVCRNLHQIVHVGQTELF